MEGSDEALRRWWSVASADVMTAISRWTTGGTERSGEDRGGREQGQDELRERADTKAGRDDATGGVAMLRASTTLTGDTSASRIAQVG